MLTLITGATGFLGGHVLLALQDAGHDVRAFVRGDRHAAWLRDRGVAVMRGDLCDYASLRQACQGVAGIVHCAALVAHGARIADEQRQVNIEGTSNLLRAAGRARAARIVHVSSIVAVGCTRDGRELDESEPWGGASQPRIHYAWTKRESEERAFAAARGGLPITVVNPAVMIGPTAQTREARGHVGAVLAGEHGRVLPGGGSAAHVADVARGVVAALESAPTNERTILGGRNVTWLELRTALARIAGRRAPAGAWPTAMGTALARGASALEAVGLSRPRWAADRFRTWGWYGYASSEKAKATLGYVVPPFDELLARAIPGPEEA